MRGIEIQYHRDEFPPYKKHVAVAVKPNGKRFSLGSGFDKYKLEQLAPKRLSKLMANPPSEFTRFLNA